MNAAHELQPVRILLVEDGRVTILEAGDFSRLSRGYGAVLPVRLIELFVACRADSRVNMSCQRIKQKIVDTAIGLVSTIADRPQTITGNIISTEDNGSVRAERIKIPSLCP